MKNSRKVFSIKKIHMHNTKCRITIELTLGKDRLCLSLNVISDREFLKCFWNMITKKHTEQFRQFLHFIDKLSFLKRPTNHPRLPPLATVFQVLNLNYVQSCCFFSIIFCFIIILILINIVITFKTRLEVWTVPAVQGQEDRMLS